MARSPKKSSACACSTLESASWRRTSSWWSGWPTSTTTGWSTSRSLSGCWRWMSWRAWKGTRTQGFVELLNYQHPATGFPYNQGLGWQNITSEHLCATCVQWTMTWWQTIAIEMPPSWKDPCIQIQIVWIIFEKVGDLILPALTEVDWLATKPNQRWLRLKEIGSKRNLNYGAITSELFQFCHQTQSTALKVKGGSEGALFVVYSLHTDFEHTVLCKHMFFFAKVIEDRSHSILISHSSSG